MIEHDLILSNACNGKKKRYHVCFPVMILLLECEGNIIMPLDQKIRGHFAFGSVCHKIMTLTITRKSFFLSSNLAGACTVVSYTNQTHL
jgi:hypothetical protein